MRDAIIPDDLLSGCDPFLTVAAHAMVAKDAREQRGLIERLLELRAMPPGDLQRSDRALRLLAMGAVSSAVGIHAIVEHTRTFVRAVALLLSDMIAPQMNAPKLIRLRRLAAGISQRELARRAGTSSATVHRYESGRVDPSVGTLNRLLRACLPRRRRWASVAELSDAIDDALTRRDEHIRRLVAEFLDDSEHADDREFALTIIDPPGPATDARAPALAAALAEHLSAQRRLIPPPWTRGTDDVRPWWFVAGDPFNAVALRESPPSFACRGIFVTAGALERT